MTNLEALRDDLQRSIDESLDLIRTVNQLRSLSGLSVNLSLDQRDFIVEWVFVRIHTAWEGFLENSFLAYMLGERSPSGFAPKRYVFPQDECHALDLVKAGRDYGHIRWTDPGSVKKHSSLCFKGGEPFQTALDLKTAQLQDMNTTRNAVVHQSRDSVEKFKSLVRRELVSAPLGVTAGKFLIMIIPTTAKTTYLNRYCMALRVVAAKIIPS